MSYFNKIYHMFQAQHPKLPDISQLGSDLAFVSFTVNRHGEPMMLVRNVTGDAFLLHSDYDWEVVVLQPSVTNPEFPECSMFLSVPEQIWVIHQFIISLNLLPMEFTQKKYNLVKAFHDPTQLIQQRLKDIDNLNKSIDARKKQKPKE